MAALLHWSGCWGSKERLSSLIFQRCTVGPPITYRLAATKIAVPLLGGAEACLELMLYAGGKCDPARYALALLDA